MNINSNIVPLNLEQATRGLVVAMAANVPVALWGSPGCGKSSSVNAIAAQLGYQMFDVRLSDKEPSDLGGIPYPNGESVKWLVPDTMPFRNIVGDIKCVLFLDEIDRADIATQNVALQLILDRRVNGHELSHNCVIIAAGNASTDIGTTQLSTAAANRLCHLYIEDKSEGAYQSWESWALSQNVPAWAISFAKFRNELFGQNDKSDGIKDMAYISRRSYTDGAVKLIEQMEKLTWSTRDIRFALVAGCIGKSAAAEMLAHYEMHEKAPTPEEIFSDPNNVAVPGEPSVLYALTLQMVQWAKGQRTQAEAFAIYGSRFPRESAAYLMKLLVDSCPNVISTQAYMDWVRKGG